MNKNVLKLACVLLAVVMLVSACGGGEQGTAAPTQGTTATTGVSTTVTQQTTSSTTVTTVTTVNPNIPEITPYDGTLTDDELRDKVLGGWIGQMAGVAFFAKSEFGWAGKIMTEERLNRLYDKWNNGTVSINDAFAQDDLYVEIPFMDAMAENGAFCDISYMAEKFKNSSFALWHANLAGRNNLLAGLE